MGIPKWVWLLGFKHMRFIKRHTEQKKRKSRDIRTGNVLKGDFPVRKR